MARLYFSRANCSARCLNVSTASSLNWKRFIVDYELLYGKSRALRWRWYRRSRLGRSGAGHDFRQQFPALTGSNAFCDALPQELAQRFIKLNSPIDRHTASGRVGADVDQILVFSVDGHHFPGRRRHLLLLGGGQIAHQTTDTFEDVDRW